MRRREFITYSGLVATSGILASNERIKYKNLNGHVALMSQLQEHIVPFKKQVKVDERLVQFLIETIYHPTYDKETRGVILQGLYKFDKFTKGEFQNYSLAMKEKVLREFEKQGGSYFLELVAVLTLEGILSDPIYGVNMREQYWKVLETEGGRPRAKERY